MFAKRVPARKWDNYQCHIAEYSAGSHRGSTDNDNLDEEVKDSGEKRLENVWDDNGGTVFELNETTSGGKNMYFIIYAQRLVPRPE